MVVVDLIRYNRAVLQRYLRALSDLPWRDVVRSRDASFDSMRNIFLHLTFAEDFWIDYVISGRTTEWVDPPVETFTDVDALATLVVTVHVRIASAVHGLLPRNYAERTARTPFTVLNTPRPRGHSICND